MMADDMKSGRHFNAIEAFLRGSFGWRLVFIFAMLAVEAWGQAQNVSNFTSLQTEIDNCSGNKAIIVEESFEITALLEIPTGCNLTISGANENITLTRGSTAIGDLITILEGASLVLSNIVIDGNEISQNGSLVQANGIFTINSGTVLQNNNIQGSDYGGVKVSGTFIMNGGEVRDNTGGYGSGFGGVSVAGGGTLVMRGGKITGNNAGGAGMSGGGVVVKTNGSFTMTGGEISNNTARSGNGGGVYVNGGSFKMTGGEITGNFSGNSTYNYNGGGVYVSSGVFEIGGTARIFDNTDNTNKIDSRNVYLASGAYITLLTDSDAPREGMEVRVATATANGVFVNSGAAANHAKYFFADESGKEIVHDGSSLYILTPTKESDLDFNLDSKTYTGLPQDVSVTPKENVNGLGEITVKYDGKTDAPVNIGTYTISVDIARSTTHAPVNELVLGTLTITPKQITIHPNDIIYNGKTYDGTTNVYGLTIKPTAASGIIEGDEITATYAQAVFDNPEVGTRTVTITEISLGGENANNYAITATTATKNVAIGKAFLLIEAKDKDIPIGSSEPEYDYITMGLANGETLEKPQFKLNATFDNTKAGTFTIEPYNAVAPNYSIHYINGTLRVSGKTNIKEDIEISGSTFTYNGEPQPINAAYNGSSENFTYKYTGIIRHGNIYESQTPPKDAGNYHVTAHYQDTDRIGTAEPVPFAIEPKPISISATHTKLYDGTTEAEGIEITLNGIVNGDDVKIGKVTAEYTSPEAGTATIEITDISLNGEHVRNYIITLPVEVIVEGITSIEEPPVYELEITLENAEIEIEKIEELGTENKSFYNVKHCGVEAANIKIKDGIESLEETINLNGGLNTFVHKTDTVIIVTPIPFEQIVVQRWHLFVINNNPATNGGHKFTEFKWLKNGEETLETRGYINPGNDPLDLFTAKMTTAEGINLNTCEGNIFDPQTLPENSAYKKQVLGVNGKNAAAGAKIFTPKGAASKGETPGVYIVK